MAPADAVKTFVRVKTPTYEDVCTGETGHVEVYWFEFENGAETYEELVIIARVSYMNGDW